MNTWSVQRIFCDAVKGTAAMFGLFLPPLTEPTPKVCRAHREKVCIICDEDSDALWMHPADGAEQLTEREAEEEVSEPRCNALRPDTNWCYCIKPPGHGGSHGLGGVFWQDADEARERIGEVGDFVSEYSEPTISTATYGELLDEINLRAVDPQQTSAHPPAPNSPAGGPPQLAPAGHPNTSLDGMPRMGLEWEEDDDPEPFAVGPDLATWLEPAVMTVLDKHPYSGGYCGCGEPNIGLFIRSEWCDHVAPLIAKHIAQALPDYPRPTTEERF